MKRSLKRVMVAAAAAVAVSAVVPMSNAAAINTVGCGDRTDFVKIEYGSGGSQKLCYANAGSVGLHLPDAYRISSGNNRITVNSTIGAITLEKWQSKRVVDGSVTITHLRIH
ncbi:beta/gamma crystallin domain-containing protein [Streptomyces sp. TRM 70361]|uniref:beta/gamma crystallin domain-containing protein n=1 Tax=Streptomyces sp. TRM 70361 TaxID=3116553 RepID=UPI002E7BB84C|nr:beta/gamma crystallin domain-containing protein [Streptomyces sp. TRM 70361]MEE1942883.1 beta/gamma crystallin domain-containing protein [Streptomyces sp. TRM 70361]